MTMESKFPDRSMLTPDEAVFHALRVYGSRTTKGLAALMREIAQNDRHTPRLSARSVAQARRRLVQAKMVERKAVAKWAVGPGLESLTFTDALRWASCQHSSAQRWLCFNGVRVSRGYAVVYKAVKADWVSEHGVRYCPGDRPVAKDWHRAATCEGGLFFWPSVSAARRYRAGGGTRYVACRIRVDHAVTIGAEKLKAPRCTVLHEVDGEGHEIRSTEAAA